MKKADNFDASKWLIENKITFQSRLNENEEQEAVSFLNQHKQEIFDKFDIEDTYGVSEDEFLNGNFEVNGPFISHDVEGYDGSSIEFTLSPNEERNNDPFDQQEVEVGGRKFYLTFVKNY
jgi:hypothetical protein